MGTTIQITDVDEYIKLEFRHIPLQWFCLLVTSNILMFPLQDAGLFTSIVLPDRQLTTTVLHGYLHFSMIFSAFIMQGFPNWLVWAKYFSQIYLTTSAMSLILYENAERVPCNVTSMVTFPKCLQNSSDYVTSAELLHDAGIDLPVYCYIGTLVFVCITLRVGVYLALRLKRPRIN